MNANQYITQVKNAFIQSVEPLFNWRELTRVAGINWGILLGAPGTYCITPKGDHLDRVHSDQKVLEMIKRGRLVLVFCGQESQTSSRDHQAWVHSGQMILLVARRKAGPHKRRLTQGLHSLKTLKWELEDNSRQPENLINLIINRQSGSLNKSQLTHSYWI